MALSRKQQTQHAAMVTFLVVFAGVSLAADLQPGVDAVAGLASVLKVGISYRDYSTRVLDAKVVVDKVLSTPSGTGEATLRNGIRTAMRFHEVAYRVWSEEVSPNPNIDNYTIIAKAAMTEFPLLNCAPLQDIMFTLKHSQSKTLVQAVQYAPGIKSEANGVRQALWACAETTTTQIRTKLSAK